MRILTRVAVSLTVLISLTACATSDAVKHNPAETFTYQHRAFDLRYAWKTSQTDQGVRVDGLIRNIRYANIERIDIKVSLLNKAHQLISEGVAYPVPQPIQINEYRNFDLLLKNAKISEGDLLQFLVNYSASEGQNGINWTSNFTVKAATGALVGTAEEKTEEEW